MDSGKAMSYAMLQAWPWNNGAAFSLCRGAGVGHPVRQVLWLMTESHGRFCGGYEAPYYEPSGPPKARAVFIFSAQSQVMVSADIGL